MSNIKIWDCDPINTDEEIPKIPFDPIGSRMVVKEFEINKTQSGLYLARTQDMQSPMDTNIGVILAVGEDVTRFQPLDVIYYGRHSGFLCELNKSNRERALNYRIMNEEDVIAKFKPEVCDV